MTGLGPYGAFYVDSGRFTLGKMVFGGLLAKRFNEELKKKPGTLVHPFSIGKMLFK